MGGGVACIRGGGISSQLRGERYTREAIKSNTVGKGSSPV